MKRNCACLGVEEGEAHRKLDYLQLCRLPIMIRNTHG